MYSSRGFRESEIGDIDVIRVGDTYHLFHLILPNHDYIAHAVSKDCMNWKRVKSALFVGDPGDWDDDMLWTMNVVGNGGSYEMYYTGLSQREKGCYQRIGKAVSSDLVHWTKVADSRFPVASRGPWYESQSDNPRHWLSWRDPYVFREDGESYLLVCARTNQGSISRRGCVGVIQLKDDRAELKPPLFTPYVYDDIECPCLVKLEGLYYLIGSIREDVKVHYWYCDTFQGEYHAFHDNVLMPHGNYAARVTRDGDHLLLYSFYVAGPEVETAHRYLPPPKELVVGSRGRLQLVSYYRWKEKQVEELDFRHLPRMLPVFRNPSASISVDDENSRFQSKSGYELWTFFVGNRNFMWKGVIRVAGLGKCGLVFNANENGDGYYISLDAVQGYVQLRAWGANPGNVYKDYVFENLQTNIFPPHKNLEYRFQLIRYGHYIEFSIDGVVKLSLVDGKFNGPNVGVYGESAEILLSECSLMTLDDIPEDDVDALDPLIPEDVMRAERYTRENRDFWHDPPGA